MAERQKYKKPSPDDILRYRENRMTNEERNAFERELQKDPFLRDAYEGLSSISSEKAASDIGQLKSKLRSSSPRKVRLLVYRIAASVAVLMIISSVFIVIERNRIPSKTASVNEFKSPAVIEESKSIKEQKPSAPLADAVKSEPVVSKSEKRDKRAMIQDEKKDQVSENKEMAIVAAENAKIEKIAEPEKLAGAGAVDAAPKAAAMRSERASEAIITGKILSSEDMKPIPGATVSVKGTTIGTMTDSQGNFSIASSQALSRPLVANFIGMESKEFRAKSDSLNEITLNPSVMALNEVVVVGYGQKKAADMYATVEYKSAEPVDGLSAFDKYVESNLVKPGIFKQGQRVVVVVSFRVNSDGSIDSIKIIRSGGQPYSDEAIRLIKNGPAWKPATDNGKPVEEDVRIRIVFK